ncbi:MAG TPA: type II toxin-antitoxin system prevent-host-death family antitoxin [Candidatus Accumulibacter phosphatis]|nr:MAG: prevent-host-death family protein [Candidatus Accumulibacter sp. SK-11]HAY27196.1 type II toxin-antitoxin system prevent-host-death family antitoxin [Accumulibacter sp.]HCN67941.1 type II toxin-antitoxin system prevent-host-death family antitoxin [Accumulibacter sp.]HRL77066.1 type II toxin-antitoxin system prevent-host-death family antitoxin [Candidatus Accumulibacter phosphatis]HRQ96465.1 type II toxin-antitoxin system prevent-host-death family antitoxin [Candidatus Accumulibacter pho
MRTVQVAEAEARFSALLAAVEAGEEISITRHGKVVARIVPEAPRMAAELFRPFWQESDSDLEAPAELLADPSPVLD